MNRGGDGCREGGLGVVGDGKQVILYSIDLSIK